MTVRVMVLAVIGKDWLTAEEIFLRIYNTLDPNVKMATILKVLYDMVNDKELEKEDGLYNLGLEKSKNVL